MNKLVKKLATLSAVVAMGLSVMAQPVFAEETESRYYKGDFSYLTDAEVEEIIENVTTVARRDGLSEEEIEQLVSIWYEQPRTRSSDINATELVVCATVDQDETIILNQNDELHFTINSSAPVSLHYFGNSQCWYIGDKLYGGSTSFATANNYCFGSTIADGYGIVLNNAYFNNKHLGAENNVIAFTLDLTDTSANIYSDSFKNYFTWNFVNNNNENKIRTTVMAIGDTDHSRTINANDIAKFQKIISDAEKAGISVEAYIDHEYWEAYDVRRDGVIDSHDLVLLRNYILGTETTFITSPLSPIADD